MLKTEMKDIKDGIEQKYHKQYRRGREEIIWEQLIMKLPPGHFPPGGRINIHSGTPWLTWHILS
jgi:hypothetical protein